MSDSTVLICRLRATISGAYLLEAEEWAEEDKLRLVDEGEEFDGMSNGVEDNDGPEVDIVGISFRSFR